MIFESRHNYATLQQQLTFINSEKQTKKHYQSNHFNSIQSPHYK